MTDVSQVRVPGENDMTHLPRPLCTVRRDEDVLADQRID